MAQNRYQNHTTSRDAAWEALLRSGVNTCPIDLAKACKALRIATHRYQTNIHLMDALGVIDMTQSDGFSVRKDGRWHIFYRETSDGRRDRVVVTHELGHIILKHRTTTRPSPVGSLQCFVRNDELLEDEANMFAARFLVPAVICWGLYRTSDVAMIQSIFDVPEDLATERSDRLGELYERERVLLNHGKQRPFLMSRLERCVYNQFAAWIIQRNKLSADRRFDYFQR